MFFDHFYYDEFQDLGGHDFNFITQIAQAKINCVFVGDFFQNTYVTSYDGRVNGTLYNNLEDYCNKIATNNIEIDTTTLNNSYRCSPTICAFVTQNFGITINSHRQDETMIIPIPDKETALKIICDKSIVKLVYDKSNEREYFSKNWGDCKGEDDYQDTCIILNKITANIFAKAKFSELAPRTKNKLYVAFTRTRGNCYIIAETIIK